MGNCIERSKNNIPQAEIRADQEDHHETTTKSGKETNGSMRIKIVLNKEELEWLVSELQNNQGKKVEDILDEIQRNRGKAAGTTNVVVWKPSLDSIVEIPEVPEP